MDNKQAIENALDDAILKELEGIEKLPHGSQERLKAIIAAANLYKARDNQYKAEAEYNATLDAKEKELEQKEKELEHERNEKARDRRADSLKTIGSLGFWGAMFLKTLKFEETGAITSVVAKTLFKVIKLL